VTEVTLVTHGYQRGDRVRDRKWQGQFTGTVRRVDGDDVFVVWDGGFVEDQLHRDDVEPLGVKS